MEVRNGRESVKEGTDTSIVTWRGERRNRFFPPDREATD
jgi:hypothetical protein